MCQPDDRAVILITTVVVLHASVYDATDGFVHVVRTDVLQVVDNFQAHRLAHTQTHSDREIQTDRQTDRQTDTLTDRQTDVLQVGDNFQSCRLAHTHTLT